MNTIIRYLLAVFFLVCAAIHIYGLFTHFTNESNASHIIHTISYMMCFVALWMLIKSSKIVYSIGAVYPFAYHLNCATQSAVHDNKFNVICWLVVVVLPLGGWWLIKSISTSSNAE